MQEQVSISKPARFSGFIFFGNYFYGLCAVALSIEAMLQQRVPLNGSVYFFLVFISTVLYYTYPYVRKCSFISSNPRTNWYARNYKLVRSTQFVITLILLTSFAWFLNKYWNELFKLSVQEWIVVFLFPVVAGLYYGGSVLSGRLNLRKVGWLKPFVIGFIWAGMVTIYPVLFYCLTNRQAYNITVVGSLLFVKNLMFVALLCIMFDIKDYATDYIHRLKTFVVGVGLRNTIFSILFPLTTAGLFSFISYAWSHGFHFIKILLNVLPFVLMIVVAWSLRKRRPIMYYLMVVDGLMLVKAVCGIIAMMFF